MQDQLEILGNKDAEVLEKLQQKPEMLSRASSICRCFRQCLLSVRILRQLADEPIPSPERPNNGLLPEDAVTRFSLYFSETPPCTPRVLVKFGAQIPSPPAGAAAIRGTIPGPHRGHSWILLPSGRTLPAVPSCCDRVETQPGRNKGGAHAQDPAP